MLAFLKDEEFIRDKVPMTKEEIRILSIAKLNLSDDSIMYDIGAGTGSVAIEAARRLPFGKVIAVEKNHEAAELIKQNVKKFEVKNITLIQGSAPEDLKITDVPTHVFIGGSSGKLIEIINMFRVVNQDVRFVVNAVTLETVSKLNDVMKSFPEYSDMEIVSVNVSHNKRLGNHNLMCAQNPVFIAGFGGRNEN